MGDFYLMKYPVISKSDRKYRVDVREDIIYRGHVMCGIFKPFEKRTIFGNKKVVFKKLNNTSIFRNVYNEEKWGYDYIAIALREIEKYEKSVQDALKCERNRSEGARKFEEWSGETQ
ncbi:hypothetical protein [Caldifermentibacillus hisashii]|uniref:hypothetical protein n=1 Tax=Caldifermentibacillus hisashii TaxID=996558 RepID=UPI0030E769F3